MQNEKILNPGFLLACCVNFLFFAAFYMLIPVLPLYLIDDLGADEATTGVLLSAYVISALAVRPWSGHIVDSYPRKRVFLLCATGYALVFWGYLWITPFLLFGLLRVLHGFAFGMANTASTTLAVDMIPQARMGTGIGFFGLTSAVPMALGPMMGMQLYTNYGATAVFYGSVILAGTGFLLGIFIPAPGSKSVAKTAGTNFWEKIYLPQAKKSGLSLACVGFSYGLVLNFISIFAKETGIAVNVGLFFCLLAVGMIVSRLFAGRFIDKGQHKEIIILGTLLCALTLVVMLSLHGPTVFLATALLYGMGTGLVMPAYQTLFINMAPPEQRGLANSSFFVAWDSGIGIALFTGGFIAQASSFTVLYFVGAVLLALSAAYSKLGGALSSS